MRRALQQASLGGVRSVGQLLNTIVATRVCQSVPTSVNRLWSTNFVLMVLGRVAVEIYVGGAEIGRGV